MLGRGYDQFQGLLMSLYAPLNFLQSWELTWTHYDYGPSDLHDRGHMYKQLHFELEMPNEILILPLVDISSFLF